MGRKNIFVEKVCALLLSLIMGRSMGSHSTGAEMPKSQPRNRSTFKSQTTSRASNRRRSMQSQPKSPPWGGIKKRDKLNGTNRFLRKPAVSCENLRLPNAIITRNSGTSAKISENLRKTANLAPFVPCSLALLIPLDSPQWPIFWNTWDGGKPPL